MSIIETAYGEQIAARLCERIESLDEATAAYQTTGDALVCLAADLATIRARHEEALDKARSAHLGDPELGGNDRARAANLAVRLHDDPTLDAKRDELARTQRLHDEAERAHKNAYHQMESARVAIGGYVAVLGAVGRG